MAKKKRSASLQADSDDEHMEDSDDEVMNEDEQEESEANDGEIPFLDTFYGLSSSDPTERAQSAHAMLQHCLLGPSANSKDAAYAFRRLLNGLCSGRAAARQGYASALATFLKVALSTGALQEIQNEVNGDSGDSDESLLAFVRDQLLKTTDTTQSQGGKFGKVKGSEERDHQFGRLFGILSIVRSGILVPSNENLSDTKHVSLDLTNDLIELYHFKKWMREPTAHGIITLLNMLFHASKSDDAKIILSHLVRNTIIPKLFAGKGLDSFTAEQIAVAVSIQSHDDCFDSELPSPLDQAVVSSATIPVLVDALSATSSVVHPRMHVVWDVLWLFLTEEKSGENGRVRSLCESLPVSDEPATKVVEALMQSLVTQSLLSIGTESDVSSPTHERRALALTIVRAACGGQINSSTAGPFVISTDFNLMETAILSPNIVKRLFVDVICAGSSSKGSHMLKPLALHVLDTIVESDAISDLSPSESLDRRLAIAKALLVNDSRFDGRTKTTTISDLLLLSDSAEFEYTPAVGQMWTKYVNMLEDQILRTCVDGDGDVEMDADEESSKPSSHETLGYIDLLFNAAKRILRLQVDTEDEASFGELQGAIIRQILGFFMASAFFDCSNLTDSTKKSKKKKKGRKQSFDETESHPIVTEGLRIKHRVASQDGSSSTLPYEVRAVLSSRFFSLLADCTTVSTSATGDRQGKDARVLQVLSDVIDGWTLLEGRGAQSLATPEDDEDDASDTETASDAIQVSRKLQEEAQNLVRENEDSNDNESLVRTRCKVGSAILASALCLQFLRCGVSDEFVDEIDEDDGEDDEDVVEMISDLQSISTRLLGGDAGESSEDDDERSPLLALTELCIHVLSSNVGSAGKSRGASPKLLREAVKFAWIGGLAAYAMVDDEAALDDDMLNALLHAIGASPAENSTKETEDEESGSDEDESDSDDSDDNKAVFSQAAGEALGLDDDSSDAEMKEAEGNASVEEDEDVELDPAQLEAMLLEDSDALLDDDDGIEVEGLEHHEGADAALANLIKLKQDARKAGRQALERLEIAKQLRCMLLIDTLLSNPGRRWSNLLQTTVFVKISSPLLQSRRDLEKGLERSSANQLGKKSAGSDSEKRALLERLTSLLKTKVCKTRWSKDRQPTEDDVVELCVELMSQVRKSNSTEHASCCSSSLLACLRNVETDDIMIGGAKVYGEAVMEWSTKRTTKISTSLFDDLLQQLPSLAQEVLTFPLIKATKDARSPFLKAESFRLLGALYGHVGGNDDPSEVDLRGRNTLEVDSSSAIACVTGALRDEEMRKTKRVKEVLKAAGKVVAFQKSHPKATVSAKELTELKACVGQVKDGSESSGVTSACGKLVHDIDESLAQMKSSSGSDSANKNSETSSSKKKKKRKGKKKR